MPAKSGVSASRSTSAFAEAHRRSARVPAVCAVVLVLEACAATGTALPAEDSGARAPPPAQRSATDGIFTRGQASRGERGFQQACAACHRRAEISRWFRAASQETLRDMYESISLTMPEGRPGSLSPEQYADILAFMLRTQEYPAGERELPADRAVLERLSLH